MAEIILKTNDPGKVAGILFEVLDLEAKRLQYSLGLAKNRPQRMLRSCHCLATNVRRDSL